ncbi:MAG: ribosomal protein [Candidatus Aminicenantes bacterium]|nr:ribosomal protein [Candidatus Aminicenantes bacterium]
MIDATHIILKPIITEKTTQLKEKNREVCFQVASRANKTEIKKAVEQLFKVKVESVRTQNMVGKWRRVGRGQGQRSGWKKAYVKLREGEKMIEYSEAV